MMEGHGVAVIEHKSQLILAAEYMDYTFIRIFVDLGHVSFNLFLIW